MGFTPSLQTRKKAVPRFNAIRPSRRCLVIYI
jgi:hypothetical protein